MSDKEPTEEDLKNMSAEEIAELQKQNCIFCRIASKEIPAKIVHEDADVICVLDINPASEGHILVYPKKHYMIMPHVPEDVLAKIFKNVKLMSHTLLKSLQCKGTTIFVANGVAAGQKAPHVLVHVFPRRENDGLVKLPEYEMSDEQIGKLKIGLSRYINQVFGKKLMKEAEFIDKKKETQSRTEEITEEDNEDEKDLEDANQELQKEMEDHKKTATPKNHKDNKKEPHEDKDDTKKPKSTKIDLDDIAKLFG